MVYIKACYRTKQILNPQSYLTDPEKIAQVKRFERCLLFANVAVILFAVGISAMIWVAEDPDTKEYSIAQYLEGIFFWVCLVIWGLALIKLYRDVKQSEKILPNKRIFVVHGTLLTFFALSYILEQVLFDKALKSPKDSIKFYRLAGTVDLMTLSTMLIELATFYLVIFMIMPLT